MQYTRIRIQPDIHIHFLKENYGETLQNGSFDDNQSDETDKCFSYGTLHMAVFGKDSQKRMGGH